MKIFLKGLGITSGCILGFTLIITLLHYFNLIGNKTLDVSRLIISIISITVGGFIIGASREKKGWLGGLKFALIVILIFILLTLIFRLSFNYKSILYYLIVCFSPVIGSMFGINYKSKNK